METTIMPNELLELIDINPPYFAYDQVTKAEDGSIFAKVPIQQPLGSELGPISAAEASRHLAILGVCACALTNPIKKRHYYLAYKGIYERVAEPKTENATLYARAECISVDRKKGEAITELHDEYGTTLVVLRVFYHVILDSTFERLYKNNFIAQPDFKLENPYLYMHGFKSETVYENEIACSMGNIPEYYCAGHFPQFPALPVAILVYNLFHMACKLAHIQDSHDSKYVIKQYEIVADNLAFAGDKVELVVKHLGTVGGNLSELLAEGFANGDKSVGKINLVLENKVDNREHVYIQKHNSK